MGPLRCQVAWGMEFRLLIQGPELICLNLWKGKGHRWLMLTGEKWGRPGCLGRFCYLGSIFLEPRFGLMAFPGFRLHWLLLGVTPCLFSLQLLKVASSQHTVLPACGILVC